MASLNDLHALTVSVARGGRGLFARSTPSTPPAKPLELYEMEGCPFCRKVRETLTELDLDYVSYPCAKGSRHRQQAVERGGKALFPLLIDPNADLTLYESEDIIDHLHATYGPHPRSRVAAAFAPVNTASAAVAGLLRPKGRSVTAPAARPSPVQLLELYNFEASPYCRKVREVLNTLDLPVLVHNVGKGGARRPELVARGGKMQVPYLVDPNHDVALYESEDIIAYLRKTW